MFNKLKIISENQPCRNCGGKLFRKYRKPTTPIKKGSYGYRSWFRCSSCGYSYMINSEKIFTNDIALEVKPQQKLL